jgi:hypothetical protein
VTHHGSSKLVAVESTSAVGVKEFKDVANLLLLLKSEQRAPRRKPAEGQNANGASS